MYCNKCGARLMEDAQYCNVCGTSVYIQPDSIQHTQAQPEQAQPKQVQPEQALPAQPQPEQPQPKQAQPEQPQPVPAPPPQAPLREVPAGPTPLKYEVFGGSLPAVSITLDAGQSIFTQSGGMAWMSAGITMQTNMQGGLGKGIGRMLSGDSLFIATYTSNAQGQEIGVASTFPGNILDLDMDGRGIIAQKSAFLCAQPSVELSAHITKRIGAGLFGGEGFILQRLSGYGMAFLEIDGSLVERELAPGETLKVDTGNVAAFEQSVTYSAEMVKGFKNILFGGEGLFLSTLTGPGKVWLQTMTLPGLAKRILPFLPQPKSGGLL